MQKAAVRELGFGALLDYYKVGCVPTTLAYWLLENFDHLRCTLKLPTGDEIPVEDKDVELVLGFPRGGTEFNRSERMAGINYLKNVPFEEEVDILYTTTKMLETVMLKDAEGGVWFKKIFLMLMETALIETSACGYVKPRIVEVIDDLTNIKTYNWCQYLLDNLLRTHKLWYKNKSKVFSGPIVFLVILYVDRVVHSKRRVGRAIPRVKGWTDLLLKQREENECKERDFGLGHVTGQYDPHEVDTADGSRDVDRDVGCVTATDNRDDGDVRSMKGVWDATKYIGEGMKMLARELNKAAPELKDKDCFKITCDTLRKAFRLDTIEFDPVGSMMQSKSANDSAAEEWS